MVLGEEISLPCMNGSLLPLSGVERVVIIGKRFEEPVPLILIFCVLMG